MKGPSDFFVSMVYYPKLARAPELAYVLHQIGQLFDELRPGSRSDLGGATAPQLKQIS